MKRWSLVGAGVGIAVAACINVRPFQQSDAGSDGTCTPDFSGNGSAVLTWSADGPGGTVTGPNYLVHFANSSSKFHFPDLLQIGGTNLVATDGVNNCSNEEEVGMALYPAPAIHANGAAMVGSANELTVVPGWTGPAATKVLVHWSTSYVCSGTTRRPEGFSQFTQFPDGRIYRHDRMADATDTEVDWSACNCNGNTGFVPTSFWTFLAAPFDTYYDEAGSGHSIGDALPNVGDQAMPGRTACLQGAGGALTVAAGWPDTGSRVRKPSPTTLALVRDFDRTAFVPTMIPAFAFESASVIMLGNGAACDAANGGIVRARTAILRSEALFVNGQLRSPSVVDGIYGGPDAPDGPGGLAVDVGSGATLTGTISSGFVVWLKFSAPVCDITIAKTPLPGGGAYYTKQKLDDDEWVVWFRDELASGQTITVNAR